MGDVPNLKAEGHGLTALLPPDFLSWYGRKKFWTLRLDSDPHGLSSKISYNMLKNKLFGYMSRLPG